MNKKRFFKRLIPIIFIALIISITWTYIRLTSKPVPAAQEMTLEIIPDYNIVSGKDLLAWPRGTVFEQGMAAYFYASGPIVTVVPTVRITGIKQGSLKGVIQSRTILRAIDDKAEVYWSYQLRQSPAQEFTFPAGIEGNDLTEFAADSINLDAPAAYELVKQINDQLMFRTGTFQMVVITELTMNGMAGNMNVNRDVSQELPLTLGPVSFTIPRTQDVMSQIPISQEINPDFRQALFTNIRSNMLLLILDAVLGILLFFLYVKTYLTDTKAEAERRKYKEWITEGSVNIKDKLIINILKLEGIVDLAIDLDKRVIYDSGLNQYYVLSEDMVYIYDPERSRSMLENKTRLGKLLMGRGLLSPEQLEIGLHYQKLIRSRLGESLIALGFIDELTLYSTLAAQQNLNYFEPDVLNFTADLSWLDKMSLQKARALMAFPLGTNTDGETVIVSSETANEGIRKALREIFGEETALIAARPTIVYQILDRIEKQKEIQQREEQMKEKQPSDKPGQGMSYEEKLSAESEDPSKELISPQDREQFLAAYHRGSIRDDLLLKVSGTDAAADLELMNLIKGLEKSVENMDYKSRHADKVPGLPELLMNSHYITADTAQRTKLEADEQGISFTLLLRMNYLTSENTLKKAELLLEALNRIITET